MVMDVVIFASAMIDPVADWFECASLNRIPVIYIRILEVRVTVFFTSKTTR
jgi:hypothetical protein